MPYRLLKSALSAVLFALLLRSPFLHAQVEPPSDVLAYKGKIDSLRSTGIQSMALRSDGRYLFVSSGAKAFNALDLQDMGLLGAGAEADANIVDVFMSSDTELVVTHEQGVQYFDVSSPFDIEEIESSYSRPAEASGLDVVRSCWINQRRTALLEDSSSGEHKLRIVDGASSPGTISWGLLFPSAPSGLDPVDLLCSTNGIYVVAMEESFGSDDKIRIARVDPSGLSVSATREFTIDTNYYVQDLVLSAKSDQLLLLFNRNTSQDRTDDSLVVPVSSESLSAGSAISVGSEATALATFKDGNQFKLGIFVGEDRLKNASNPPLNQLLIADLPFSSVNQIQSDRGEGSAEVGLRTPSRWFSSTVDHYKYGLSEGLGISLIGRGPRITVTERPSSANLTQSNPLTFKFSTDRGVKYQLRLDQNYDKKGTSAGLSREPGVLVQSGNLSEDQETDQFSFSTSALNLSQDRSMSLSIISWDPTLGDVSSPQTRIGIPFTYDPPPGQVQNLRLKYGDQSIHIYFDPPTGGDIDSYLVDYSYTESDLDDAPLAERTFESGLEGYTLSSPKTVKASSFNGKIVLSPFENYRVVSFRVYAMDAAGQITESPTTLTGQGYNTLTVPQAVGGVASCVLDPERGQTTNLGLSLLIFLQFIILVFFVRRKES